jgi:hypothetical protein
MDPNVMDKNGLNCLEMTQNPKIKRMLKEDPRFAL